MFIFIWLVISRRKTISIIRLCKIITSNRRFIKQVKRNKKEEDYFTDPLPCEIDNHADTICFGNKIRPIYFTSEVCSVSPYLSEYENLPDIQICTASTAVDLESGETIILEFGQGIWFGNRMDRSLINPNQCRHYGIPICDDPTDPHRNLGIQLNDNLFLLLRMKGTTCYFVSRCPLIHELESYQTFQVSDPQHWDPTENMFVCSVGRGKMRVQNPYCHSFDYIHNFDKIN